MVSFRKSLMVVTLLALCAGLAMAQCSFSGTSVLRHEGVAEPLVPINISCTDVTAGAPDSITGTYNITLYSGAPITSAPATSKVAAEIELMAGGTPYAGTLVNSTTVTFSNVALVGTFVPGVPAENTYAFSLTGIRLNASTVQLGGANFSSGVGLTLFATPADKVSPAGLFNGSEIYNLTNVAYAIPTFGFNVSYKGATLNPATPGTEVNLSQCNPSDPNVATPTVATPVAANFPVVFNLNFVESYSAAFLTLADEGPYATQGTRLSATFTNLPANTQLWVPAGVTTGTISASLVLSPAADGSGGTLAVDASPEVGWYAVTPGTAIVYEVTAESMNQTETLAIPVSVAYTGVPSLAAATSGTVSANYAPQSSNPGAISSPIPRFSSAPVTGSGLYSVVACSTSLLFPYVTSQPGWNVGLAVSNTGTDPFGNTGQSGTCAFSFFGATGAPAAPVTLGAAGFGDSTAIAPGTTSADVLSNALATGANFTGYAIAVCNFQYAHGYAFVIGNNTKSTFAHGYLALVLQGTGTNPPLARGGQNGQYEKVGN